MTIPVIDFSQINGSAEQKKATMLQIANGCEKWGFFQLVNHGISEELLERVKQVASKCYELERGNVFQSSAVSQSMNSLLEAHDGGDEAERMANVDWEDVFYILDDGEWPVSTPGFKETMAEYRGELKKLAFKVIEVMEENLGLPKGYIETTFDGSGKAYFGTKVSHYPPCPNVELVEGLRPHTDAGGVILLFQDDEVGGLQVLKDGQWIDVQPLRNSIVINTGDQIEVLSNGKYKSAWHRVLATREGTRRSIASFYNPSIKAVISPAAEMLEKESCEAKTDLQAYPKYLFGDYMSVYAEQKYQPKEPRFEGVKAV